jgi:hypothetical protein
MFQTRPFLKLNSYSACVWKDKNYDEDLILAYQMRNAPSLAAKRSACSGIQRFISQELDDQADIGTIT